MNFKKLFIMTLCSVILVNSTMISYKKANANALALAGVVGSGLTLGGVIATTIAVGAALYGVSVVIDNWDDITDTVGNALNNATGEVKEWWDSLTESAVHKDDPVYTLNDAKTDGKVINFYDYYKPPSDDNNKKIDVTLPVLAKVMEVLEEDIKEPIIPSSSQVEEIVRQMKLHGNTITDSEIKYFNNLIPYAEYKYLYSYGYSHVHAFSNYTNVPYLYIYFDSFLRFELRFNEDTTSLFLSNYNYATQSDPVPSVSNYNYTANTGVNTYSTVISGLSTFINNGTELTTSMKNEIINNIFKYAKYTSEPIEIKCSDDLAKVFPELTSYKMTGYNLGTLVNKSNHTLNLNGKTSITINQNDTLINELNNSLTSGEITDTDKYIESLNKANNDAILVGDPVLDTEISFDNLESGNAGDTDNGVTGDDVTESTNSIIDAIKEFIHNPLGSLKFAFDDFVTWIKESWQDIKNAPTQIIDYLKEHDPLEVIINLPGQIASRIGETIKSIFVPDDAALQEFIDNARDTIENQTGILTYPTSLVVKFIGFLADIGKQDCIIKIPEIKFQNQTLLKEYTFNFTKYVNDTEIKTLYDIYLTIVDFIMVMWIVNLARKKADEIMRGA